MPNRVRFQPSERVDLVDIDAVSSHAKELVKLLSEQFVLDSQSRILRGFRVELANQATSPGRIIVHSGTAFDRDGQILFNEEQSDVTRTVTLEGASSTFYVELEFIEGDAAIDSRAFWDPTVDQGTDVPSGDQLPDGQEFNANVATRKSSDWRIVQPISTTAFERDLDPSSTKVPLIKLSTNGSNEIDNVVNPGLTTEKAATTLLEQISTTKIRVQNAKHMPRIGNSLKVSEGLGIEETVTVNSIDRVNGIIGVSVLSNTHAPGAIVRSSSVSEPDFIIESDYGRYRRASVGGIDWRDRVFQGDEVHGDILSRGHGSPTARSSVNLQSLQDHVDYLSAQIQEMKWGSLSPYTSGTDSSRTPPGLVSSLPATPRHYDRAGGIMWARTAAITVGDGINSFGDFDGATQAVLQAAHDALPVAGGRIFLKRGYYTLSSDLNWTNAGVVVLEGEEGSQIACAGGSVHIATIGSVIIKNLTIIGFSSNIGILVDTSNPSGFVMQDVYMADAAFNLNAALPGIASFARNRFWGTGVGMASTPLFAITGTNGTISGTFIECDFYHLAMSSLTCCLIDAVNGSPTTAMTQANFVDCSFTSALLNLESIHLGSTSNIVNFTRCTFFSLLTLCHVRATGGSNIKFIDCVGLDGVAQFFQGVGINHVEVSGYVNNNPVAWPAVEFANCNYGKITRCDVSISSVTSLTGSAFRLTYSGAVTDYTDFLIDGNTVVGSGKATGVIFDLNGGQSCREVKITNNMFNACEVGVYFANSGAAATYYDLVLTGNNLFDKTPGGTLHKVGFYFGPNSTKTNVIISNNTIADMRTANTDLVAVSVSRAAVWVRGTSNTNFKISENEIKFVGDSSFLLPNTSGIFIESGSRMTISGNQIETITGAAAFGIRVSGTLTYSSIVGNTINDIETISPGGGGIQDTCFGVSIENLSGVSITGNTFYDIVTGVAAAAAAAIGNVTGQWFNASISGNNLTSNDDQTFFFYSASPIFRKSSITGNTCLGTSYAFSHITCTAGGTVDNSVISGNSAEGMLLGGIYINILLAATKRNFSITGNMIHPVTGHGIDVTGVDFMTIAGNVIMCAGVYDDVHLSSCTRFCVTANVGARAGGVADNIVAGSGCNYYVIHGNVLDDAGGVGGNGIITTAAGQTGTAKVTDNVVDNASVAVGTDDTAG